jgi:hypothetical protein
MAQSVIDERVSRLADEIVEYLGKHPAAADTIDGIVSWWLPRQRYETAYDLVSKALEILVQSGSLITIQGQSSKTVYKLNSD